MKTRIAIFGAAVTVILTASLANIQAQYQHKSAAEIWREAQERQRAIDQAGRDFQRGLSKILEDQQAQRDRERQLRLQEQQARREEEQAERERQADAQRQRQAELQQQREENDRRRQESVRQERTANQQALQSSQASQSSPSSASGSPERLVVRPVEPKPLPLAGSPNEQGARPEGWGAWKHVSENIWVSFSNVNRNSKQSKPVWTWSLKNWNDREVKTIWIAYYENGKWWTDLNPIALKPGAAFGGWGTFTAEGTEPPPIRITKVDYK